MTKEEIFEMKKTDIIGALNLALIVITGVSTIEELRKKTNDVIDMLTQDITAIDSVDKFLELQSLIIGDR